MPKAVIRWTVAVALALAPSFGLATVLAAGQADAAGADAGKPADARRIEVARRPFTGDFDRMLERRVIRVMAPYSRSLYYVDQGQERGITAELARDFERYVNRKHAKQLGKRPLTVVLVVTTRDRMFGDLASGLGDIAAGNLTVTPKRSEVADFVAPTDRGNVRELLVTGPSAPVIASLDDLAGKTVHVRKASSYHDSLMALNERLAAANRPAVNVVAVPDALEDEDMMEMVNAGVMQAIVVDDWKATMWAQALPRITVHRDVVLRDDGRTGWAIRKDSPQLAAAIEDFYRTVLRKQGVIETRLAQHMRRVKQIRDPTTSAEYRRFESTVELFRKYGDRYRFDPLMLAAQGFQESGLDQNAKSAVGAIGVMQVMPATGKELAVGDIAIMEPNIHAGAKYLDHLMARAFPDARFDDANRALFAFASYNCGPGNVRKARREAARRGLDPDVWFNNVEIVVGEQIGMETTTYVRNIFKYYAAYRLVADARQKALAAREQFAPVK
jgi:membrane-bound lytic murein transglycosylase MltF